MAPVTMSRTQSVSSFFYTDQFRKRTACKDLNKKNASCCPLFPPPSFGGRNLFGHDASLRLVKPHFCQCWFAGGWCKPRAYRRINIRHILFAKKELLINHSFRSFVCDTGKNRVTEWVVSSEDDSLDCDRSCACVYWSHLRAITKMTAEAITYTQIVSLPMNMLVSGWHFIFVGWTALWALQFRFPTSAGDFLTEAIKEHCSTYSAHPL